MISVTHLASPVVTLDDTGENSQQKEI